MDGLLGALGWFDDAYRVVCERADMGLFAPRQYIVMRMIARFTKRRRAPQINELAAVLGVDKAYVSRLTRSLVDEGIVRARETRDRRTRPLELTEYGDSLASPHYLAQLFWELLVDEFGIDAAHALARATTHLALRPDFGPHAWPVDD